MSESGHELSELTFLALGKQGRRVRLVHLFTPPPSSLSSGNHLEHVADLQAPRRGRRQAKPNSLADKLTVEAKVLAGLKIEKAAVEGERRAVEADLGPVRYLAALLGQADEAVLRWFILIVALLLDPAAVLLLIAATWKR
jgi:hypothetical protein